MEIDICISQFSTGKAMLEQYRDMNAIGLVLK